MSSSGQSPQRTQIVIEEADSFEEDVPLVPADDAIIVEEDSFEKSFELISINEDDRMEIDEEASNMRWQSVSSPENGRALETAASFSAESVIDDSERQNNLVVILGAIAHNHCFSPRDVNTVTEYFTEGNDPHEFGEILEIGLGKLMLDAQANPLAITAILRFVAIVSLKVYFSITGRQLVFEIVHRTITNLIDRPEAFCRIRGCQLIGIMLAIKAEMDVFEDESIEPHKLPSIPLLEWRFHLSQRRLDKDVQVRCAALHAISKIQVEKIVDHKGRKVSVLSLISSSLNDISPEVRKTAIKVLAVIDDAVDVAIRFLGFDDELPSIRLQMAEKIIENVHINAFKERPRITFLSQLLYDSDEAAKSLLGTKLVGTWLRQLGDKEIGSPRMEGGRNLPAHPFALLKVINFVKHEDLVAVLVKLALSHYMDVAVGSRSDGLAFLEFMRKMPHELRESSAALHKKSVAKEILTDGPDLASRLFMHRCLVEFLASLYTSPDDYGKKELILSKLVPNAKETAELFAGYVVKIFAPATVASINQLFCFKQIRLLIHLVDLGCPTGRKAYEEALKMLIADETVNPPLDIVEAAVQEMWDYVVRDEDPEEFITWAGFAVGKLLDAIPALKCELRKGDTREYTEIEYATFLRAATVLEGVLRCPAVATLSPLLRAAFNRMADSLPAAASEHGRILACKLVGLTASLDETGVIIRNNCCILRHALFVDVVEVKIIAFKAMVDLIWKYGFDKIAENCFPEIQQKKECSESLAEIPEQLVLMAPEDKNLAGIIFDACRLVYMLVWPNLIGSILYRVFNGNNDGEVLHTAQLFFKGFVDKGIGAKIELVAGFMACCKIVEKIPTKFRFGAMMEFVCELISRKGNDEIALRNDVTVDTLFAMNLLRKIASDPLGDIQPHLVTCLSAINLSRIQGRDAKIVHKTALALVRTLSNDSSLAKMFVTVDRFATAMQKHMDAKGKIEKSLRRRHVTVKVEEEEDDDEMDEETEEIFSLSSKRPRLCRHSGNDTIWSRSDEVIVKEEPLSQVLVQLEPVDQNEEEVITIETDDEEDEVTVICHVPAKRRRLSKRVAKPLPID